MEIGISETVEIRSIGKDEVWLQDQIWNNPSVLGFGDLEVVDREQAVSSGGRLDILLKNSENDAMYEVEVMLGDTDPSHIIRTIEYWDLIKRKWPQRQHFAVLVAERITRRFFNVIHILSESVPLIAIQANIVKNGDNLSLHFTKILDVYDEPEDDTSTEQNVVDEQYWKNKNSEVLSAIQEICGFTTEAYETSDIKLRHNEVVLFKDRYRLISVSPRRNGHGMIAIRHGGREAVSSPLAELLEQNDIAYVSKPKAFRIMMRLSRIGAKETLFRDIATINYEWWLK